jgi:hypothetical protein
MACFRLKGTNDINKKLLDALNLSRKIHMVPSAFHDKFVIRFALCAEDANEKDIDDAWRIISEFATATIHGEESEGRTTGGMQSLIVKQHQVDDYEKAHPDKERDSEELEAEELIKTHRDEEILHGADVVALDGSWSVGDSELINEFDKYVESHPEMYEEKEVMGEVKISKVPSMLRHTKIETIEKRKSS